MPIVKLLDTHVVGYPGDEFNAFGHKFVIQHNGDAHCDMHPDFLPTEVPAGRVALVEGRTPIEQKTSELEEFGFDIGNYYGAGDLDKLIKRVEKLRKELKIEFAETRLQLSLPQSYGNRKMVDEITANIENKRE